MGRIPVAAVLVAGVQVIGVYRDQYRDQKKLKIGGVERPWLLGGGTAAVGRVSYCSS